MEVIALLPGKNATRSHGVMPVSAMVEADSIRSCLDTNSAWGRSVYRTCTLILPQLQLRVALSVVLFETVGLLHELGVVAEEAPDELDSTDHESLTTWIDEVATPSVREVREMSRPLLRSIEAVATPLCRTNGGASSGRAPEVRNHTAETSAIRRADLMQLDLTEHTE